MWRRMSQMACRFLRWSVHFRLKESKERVRTALKNTGYILPPKRITINFIPANIRKTGSGFDLPVVAAVLCAIGIVPEEALKNTMVVGEISLSGR